MRFARIDLDKYGHLTGLSLDLTVRSPDLHILVGDNEAGKSTTQAALADLLYGFGHKTDYAFLHDMRDLRVGARITNRKTTLEAWRRKARGHSLQESDGKPLDDDALDAFLVGVDRDTFLQQFSLNHMRLRAGGEAILEAHNDLGRMLFQAGAGLDWLGERLRDLEEQSAELFKPAGSKQALAKALKQREQALKKKKEAAASDRAFKEARSAEQQARQGLCEQTTKRERIAAERTKLERAHRVIPVLRQIDQNCAALASFGPLPSLPAHIREIFDTAVQAQKDAHRAVETASRELGDAERVRDAVIVDELFLEREGEIERILGVFRSRYLAAEEDLPKRLAELKAHEMAILNRCREVGRPGMTPGAVVDHLPTRQQVAALRRLASEHREHMQTVRNADEAVKKVRNELQEAKAAAEAFGPTPDMAALHDAIEVVSADPGLETRIEQIAKAAITVQDDIAKRASKMVPNPPEEVLRKTLPSAATVSQYVTDLAALNQRVHEQREEHRRLQRLWADYDRDRETLMTTGKAVSSEHLEEARARRDLGWDLIRRRFIDGQAPDTKAEKAFSAEQPLPDAFAAAIVSADTVADSRFDAAEISGKLAAKIADLHGLDGKLADLTKGIEWDEAARGELLTRWEAEWTSSGIVPEAPSSMAEWLRELEGVEECRIDLRNIECDLATERSSELRHRTALVMALKDLSTPEPGTTEGLTRLLKRAQAIRSTIEKQQRELSAAVAKVQELTRAESKAAQALAEARAALAIWQRSWSSRMVEWSLPDGTDPADVEPVLDAWDGIRTAHDKIDGDQGLRYRIRTMQDDLQRFVQQLDSMVAGVAPDLREQPASQAAQELGRRLAKVRTDRDLKASATKNVTTRTDAYDMAVDSERNATKSVDDILRQIGADSIQAAEPVLDRVEKRAHAERTLAELREALQKVGNGLAEATLRNECADLEFDALDGRVSSLESEAVVVFDEVRRLSGILGERKAELDPFMQASAAAADAAAEAEQASTDALRAAERFIRLQVTATMLRHAIHRYRKENEGPLLRRASGLFRDLTLHRYEGLEIDHDSGDKPALRARQANNGTSVPVESLSDGARDQLFLALRLAGIDELLVKGTVLPFVADDLFVNFDDDRATAGLKVLADLATRTQVLFFTHHQHLVDLASRHIPKQFSTLRLATS